MRNSGILENLLKKISVDLSDAAVEFALIGGLAVGRYTTPRMTKDVDLCIAVDSDQEAEKLVRYLVDRGYGVVSVLEHISGRLATIRLTVPQSQSLSAEVDLMFCSCGIEDVITKASKKISVFGRKIRVASIGHIIAMKVLSESPIRLTDQSDLQNLLKIASPIDLKQARSALKLIRKRGFNRGKDLLARLNFFCRKNCRRQSA